ncbi:hypothetical protein HC823_01870 [Candidatus Gracilibacteria bacterium]|nr:hypothetical protein [Candidatus Gracilibacteria bacterium]
MIGKLRKAVPERSGVRLLYHKLSAMAAAIFFRFPANNLTIVGVTGTAGKSTTTELIHYILQNGGAKCGSLSSIQFHVGDKVIENETLRTTLRPWYMQKYLRQMVKEKCTHCVIEVSSHAIDQNRIWGIPIDIAVLTNTSDNEHLDYHKTHSDYIKTKAIIFKNLYKGYRKANVQKQMVLNADDPQFDLFYEFSANKKWTFSRHKQADVRSDEISLTGKNISFTLKVPNHTLKIDVPMVGSHNLENILTAIAVSMSVNIPIEKTAENLKNFPGAPGRLEPIESGQAFSVIVDHTYKPSALAPVLETLKK